MTRSTNVPPPFLSVDAFIDRVVAVSASRVLRRRGVEVILSPCPVGECKGDKFSIRSDTGLWNCPKCGQRGNAWQLAKFLGMEPVGHAAAEPESRAVRWSQERLDALYAGRAAEAFPEPVLAYLQARGITSHTALDFGLIWRPTRDSFDVGFPYHRQSGRLARIKWRSIAEKGRMSWQPAKDEMPPPEESPLFHVHKFDPESPPVLTEGEFDAMALGQTGIRNVMSVANGALAWDETWSRLLAPCREIYVAFDADENGEKGVEQLRRRFGREIIKRVRFGTHKDANDALKDGWDGERFSVALEEARCEPPSIVRPLRELAMELCLQVESGNLPEPVMTGLAHFDETQRGLRPGELTVVTAHTGEGKTTWLLDLCLRLAEKAQAACFMSLEQPASYTVQQLVSMLAYRYVADMDRFDVRAVLRDVPLSFYVGMEPERDRLREVSEALRFCRVVYDLRVVVVDHLDHLIEPAAGESRYSAACRAVKEMHRAARDHEMAVILVCQPTTDSGRSKGGAKRREVFLEDIAETRLARQLAANGWVISTDKETSITKVRISKARYAAAKEGIELRYRFDGFRYHEDGIDA